MARRTIGSRAVRSRQVVKPILTVDDVSELRRHGHEVLDLGNGEVNVVGSGIFRVLGQKPVLPSKDVGNISLVAESDSVHAARGMDIGGGGFSIVAESDRIHPEL